jgi:hypothetical protein
VGIYPCVHGVYSSSGGDPNEVDHPLIQEYPTDPNVCLIPKAMQTRGHGLIEAVECHHLLTAAVEEQVGQN